MRPENVKSSLALLSILTAFVLGVSGAALAAEPGTFSEALAQAAQEDKILVVDFYTDY